MYYGARYYDPSIGRFTQADTIVPEAGDPQTLNRYAYGMNNPVKFVDPTGHCALDSGDNITKFDCTVDDFNALSWEDRERWAGAFLKKYRLGNWLGDIQGAVHYLGTEVNFREVNGWAFYMDAGVLQAINDGMLLAQGKDAIGFNGSNGGGVWSKFFKMVDQWFNNELSDDDLIPTRLAAEQAGVDYAQSLPESQRRLAQASVIDQMHIDIFLSGANSYRSLAPKLRPALGPLQVACNIGGSGFCGAARDLGNVTNPRTSWSTLSLLGKLARPAAWLLYGSLSHTGD